MILVIELSEEDLAALSARALAQGVSTGEYVRQILKRDIHQSGQPITARIREIWSAMPEDVRAKLPADGASQIDHYVHSHPKKNV